MQPDREQEQRHPDLREQLDVGDRAYGRAPGVGTDHDAGQDVAEDQGQPEPLGDEPAEKGRHQYERYVARDAHAPLHYLTHVASRGTRAPPYASSSSTRRQPSSTPCTPAPSSGSRSLQGSATRCLCPRRRTPRRPPSRPRLPDLPLVADELVRFEELPPAPPPPLGIVPAPLQDPLHRVVGVRSLRPGPDHVRVEHGEQEVHVPGLPCPRLPVDDLRYLGSRVAHASPRPR